MAKPKTGSQISITNFTANARRHLIVGNFEFGGETYQFRAQRVRTYRIVKLVHGQIHGVLETGNTSHPDSVLKGWNFGSHTRNWNKQANFGLAIELQQPDGSWRRMKEKPHKSDLPPAA